MRGLICETCGRAPATHLSYRDCRIIGLDWVLTCINCDDDECPASYHIPLSGPGGLVIDAKKWIDHVTMKRWCNRDQFLSAIERIVVPRR